MSTNTKKRFLLTGGRAPATLDLARQLAAHGHQVYVAESLEVHLCQFSRAVQKCFQLPVPKTERKLFIQRLLEIIEQYQIDILIPTCEEIFHIAHAYARFAAVCRIWTEPIDCLNRLHNKLQFIQLADQLGFTIPKTQQVVSRAALCKKITAFEQQKPIVIKPVYSRFASNTCILNTTEQPPAKIQPTVQTPWLVQEWVPGAQICTYTIADKGSILAHAAYQTEFTAGQGATIAFTPYFDATLYQCVQKWIHSLQLTGQFAFDWIYTPDKKWIPIECNPRLTSGIHLFTSTDRIDRVFSGVSTDSPVVPKQETKRCLQFAMWSYGLGSVRSWRRWKQWWKAQDHKDIVFRWTDPFPFWGQIVSLLSLWRLGRRYRLSITEASTYDIEWNGDTE